MSHERVTGESAGHPEVMCFVASCAGGLNLPVNAAWKKEIDRTVRIGHGELDIAELTFKGRVGPQT